MDFSIGTQYYKDIISNTDTKKISSVSEDSSDKELLQACKEFESYMVEQMFKAMEATIPKDEKDGEEGSYLSMFQDTLYQGYVKDAVEKEDFGIARMLYESMKRN